MNILDKHFEILGKAFNAVKMDVKHRQKRKAFSREPIKIVKLIARDVKFLEIPERIPVSCAMLFFEWCCGWLFLGLFAMEL